MTSRTVAIIDIGKTNAKVILRDVVAGRNLLELRRANETQHGPPFPHFDTDGLWIFILEALSSCAAQARVDAISVTTHGACAALVDESGLVLPVLDYESALPDNCAGYETVRPPFAQTFSPRLPGGLNLGAQLFFLEETYPDAFARARHILLYPQYWVWRLTGVATSEVTSLGCHTDLWAMETMDFSDLVDRRGWRAKFPALRSAFDAVGRVRPEIAEAVGFHAGGIPVHCGIHDSNASLLPHLLERTAPFTVVSTGTWIISFAVGGDLGVLEDGFDALANVDAFGRPVPSARFMGGREFELICGGEKDAAPAPAELEAVLRAGAMALPTFVPGTGPFPHQAGRIVSGTPAGAGSRVVVASLYAALMTGECLRRIGAGGPTLVDGPFAANPVFIEALRLATGRPVEAGGRSFGAGEGAALLAAACGPPEKAASLRPSSEPSRIIDPSSFAAYAKAWTEAVARAA